MIKIIKPGLYSTIQDKGRVGIQSYGVPYSGSMDSFSSDLANKILNNSEDAAVIEITMVGPVLEFNNETVISSDYAIMYNRTNIVDMRGNVIINNYDGSELKTNQLFWDPEQEWLFSEEKFTFKNIDYDIAATRLDANRSFTIFNTGKLDGKVLVDDN